MMRVCLFLLGAVLLCMPMAFAQNTPQSSKDAKQVLQSIQKNLAAKKSEHQKLAKQAQSINGEVTKLQKDLIASADAIQNQEQALTVLNADVAKLSAQETVLQSAQARQRADLYNLSGQLLPLARTPPAALIFAPTAPKEIIQTQLVLQQTGPALLARVKQAQSDLAVLNSIKNRKGEQMARAENAKADLLSSRQKMDQLLQKRQQAYAATKDDLTAQETELKQLAAQANDLQDLIAVLQKAEVARVAAEKARQLAKGNKAKPSKVLPAVATGSFKLPAAGQVVRGFGSKDRDGKPIKGLAIQTTASSQVVAPASGDVMYAGPFRSYGQIVILGISQQQYIILGGLGGISVKAGEHVNAGEPLARMPSDTAPELYIEIREGGEPINPSKFGLSTG